MRSKDVVRSMLTRVVYIGPDDRFAGRTAIATQSAEYEDFVIVQFDKPPLSIGWWPFPVEHFTFASEPFRDLYALLGVLSHAP